MVLYHDFFLVVYITYLAYAVSVKIKTKKKLFVDPTVTFTAKPRPYPVAFNQKAFCTKLASAHIQS